MESAATSASAPAIQEEAIIRIRKEKIQNFLKTKYQWITYIALAGLVWLAVWIRTLNLPRLRDVTTGGWTLGPDLDPFLFLRWAKYIIENGSLMAIDAMRYVPLGYETKGELILLPYMMAWFHKIAAVFGSASIEQSAAIFPAVMFGLTVLAFFLFARKIFSITLGKTKSNIIALIASLILIVSPSLLPRTIAGIPEKESVGFFFMFLAFYFFLSSWRSKKNINRNFLALLAGASTAGMALVWGGVIYIFVAISITTFIAFFLGQVKKEKFYLYTIWLFSSFILMYPFSTRYTAINLASSTVTGAALAVFLLLAIHFLIFSARLKKYTENPKLTKIPKYLLSLIITVLLMLLAIIIFFGPGFIISTIQGVVNNLITPITTRFGVTVAENRQPFFPEWSASFGPIIKGVPIIFWLFCIGSVYLFYHMLNEFSKKERNILTFSYALFLLCIIFSRYKSDNILNGTNTISLIVYGLGFIILLLSFSYYYRENIKRGEQEKFQHIDIGLLLLFALFFFSIISARGAVRVIMVLVPPASILVSYFIIALFIDAQIVKVKARRIILWAVFFIVIIFAALAVYQLFQASKASAEFYAPSAYTQQWQKAMAWVRNNTEDNSVFSHWWDYGYWVQSIGERATVLDGGNAIVYWNHLMGRHALTGRDELRALEFLCTHNTTHFLIDSTDIGKYSAFSSIGSDVNYDRVSFIPSLVKDAQQVRETKNGTLSFYAGGFGIDDDIFIEVNSSNIFLPKGKAAIAGILLETDILGLIIKQPIGVFIDNQNKRYDLPLRYAYYDENLTDFGTGLEAGIFLIPRLLQSQGQPQLEKNGALLYLSNRTVKSQLARLYLYKEKSPYFNLVHSENDFVVELIKSQQINSSDFVYDEVYAGARGNVFAGPIRIWEINCPKDRYFKPEYLDTNYPDIRLTKA